MSDFKNLRTGNRKVFYFITPLLRLYYASLVISQDEFFYYAFITPLLRRLLRQRGLFKTTWLA